MYKEVKAMKELKHKDIDMAFSNDGSSLLHTVDVDSRFLNLSNDLLCSSWNLDQRIITAL